MDPDSLEKSTLKTKLNLISSKSVLGKGKTGYPINTETGERMMMIYFPDCKTLYTSDLVQKMPDGSFFQDQYISEIDEAVKRENLDVKTMFGMHLMPTDYFELTNAVRKANSGN